MKIGMTSLTLRNEIVENVIKYAKEAGLSGIEWGVSDLHMPLCDKAQAEKIKKLSAQNGLEIFSLGSYCRMLDKEDCEKAVETAAILRRVQGDKTQDSLIIALENELKKYNTIFFGREK